MGRIFGERCVRCGQTRTKREFEGVPTCDACELAVRADRETAWACPSCSAEMEKRVVLNVIVDQCRECHGAWLDAGELDVLKGAIDSGAGSDLATGMLLGMAIG